MERFREATVVLVALLATYVAVPPQPLDPAYAHSGELRSELTRVVTGFGAVMATGAEAEGAPTP